jgi:hypothetical protein
MGHYRSEMGYEDEDRSEAERRVTSLRKTERKIQTAIDKYGIAAVLAEMVVDGDTMFRIKYRG